MAPLLCGRRRATEELPLKAVSTPYNRAHHGFAVFVACATFLLIIAGALVTSNDAGLSIPDWPTSFHSFKVPSLTGGIRYEWSHRAIAGSIICLTVSIAIWTWIADRRRWMKWLGVAALSTILAQAVLGGLTVLLLQPPWVSSAHAAVGQTFFCIAVCIAMFTGRRWVEEEPRVELDIRRPSLFDAGWAVHLHVVCPADPGSDVPPPRHELVAACAERRAGVRCAGMDVHSCLVAVRKDRRCPASGDYHVVIADCAALPRLYRVYYPGSLGT